jgi:hypothetical protein
VNTIINEMMSLSLRAAESVNSAAAALAERDAVG